MLSKIQTDTRLSGRLLDQGLRRAKPLPCVLELVCASQHLFSLPPISASNRRVFNRLDRISVSPRCLANFLRISNFDTRVNQAFSLSPDPTACSPSSLSEVARKLRPFSKSKIAHQPTHSHCAKNSKNRNGHLGRGALSSSKTHPQRERLRLSSTAVTWAWIRSALNSRPSIGKHLDCAPTYRAASYS